MGKDRVNLFILRISDKRTTFNWIFFILVLLLGKGSSRHLLAGIPFIMVGESLRTLSAGTVRKNKILTRTGPYALCRHPLYLGSLLISIGFTVISYNLFISLYFIILFPLTYIPAMISEERFLAKKFDKDYSSYKKSVPGFIPKPKRINLSDFSWKQVKKNGEYLNWIVITILIVAALIKPYLILNK